MGSSKTHTVIVMVIECTGVSVKKPEIYLTKNHFL